VNSPFNKENYNSLLEGLEISIKSVSEVFFDNPTSRLDSEYFKKEYISLFNDLKKNRVEKLEKLSRWITQGPNPTFNEDGEIPCLTGRNINKGNVNYNNPDLIDNEEYEKLKRFQLKEGDTLITLKGKGSIGQIGFVTDERKAIFSRNIGIMRPGRINAGYLNAYILSFYGSKLIERGETGGTGQSTLTTAYLKNLDVPRFKIESEIGRLIELSEEVLKESQLIYSQAELLLIKNIGIKDFEPSKHPINIKSFSDTFKISGRLDAEYYQLKYEQIVDKIKSTTHDKLSNLVNIKKSIEPGSANYTEEGLPFIRVSDYDKFGLSTPDKYLTDEFIKENEELINDLKPNKETILFSKDGSVGTAYMLRKDADFITSGAILHLIVKDKTRIIPEYLTLALNSKLVQMQAERDAGGSIILHWRVNEIKNVVIPLIDYDKQKAIAELVEESFKQKGQSEHLLDVAKRAVELAIEKDEEIALEFINSKRINI
jgi:type I restriction enzyme S subunit